MQLMLAAAAMKDRGERYTAQASMAKLFAGQLFNRMTAGCLRMHGGMGFMDEMLISRYYRDSIGLSIGGDADEVMRDVIAKLEGY